MAASGWLVLDHHHLGRGCFCRNSFVAVMVFWEVRFVLIKMMFVGCVQGGPEIIVPWAVDRYWDRPESE